MEDNPDKGRDRINGVFSLETSLYDFDKLYNAHLEMGAT